MLLAIDIGNTHTVVGVFRNESLIADWRLTSSAHRTIDEVWVSIKNFCLDASIPPDQIDGVGISSVVPNLTDVFDGAAKKYLKVQPVIVNANLDLGFDIQYTDKSAVGADRLCNAIAGYARYGGPIIIIDFGTATTYDVISKDGTYLGGVISLGVESSAAELHRRAAKLPKVELHFPENVIGKDTVSSMQAGLMYGAVDAVEGTIRRINKELGAKTKVIATGGLSALIAKETAVIEACEPSLVLDGIRLIYERVRK